MSYIILIVYITRLFLLATLTIIRGMATSFGWKNKRLKLNKSSDSTGAFSEEAQVDPGAVDDDVDWLHNIPIKRQCIQLEDVSEKTKRLTEEGVALAEQGRYNVIYLTNRVGRFIFLSDLVVSYHKLRYSGGLTCFLFRSCSNHIRISNNCYSYICIVVVAGQKGLVENDRYSYRHR